MPTPIAGLRGTGQFTTDFRPTNYRELYTMLEPNGSAPLNALLAMASSEATDDPKFNHFRDELPDRTLKINNGAGYNTSATSLTVDAGAAEWVRVGTIIVNSATGEIMRATADGSGTTLTVERNIGGTSFTITDNDDLFVAGSAYAEGASSSNPVSFDPTTDFNYTQIFRTPVKLTGTMRSTYLRTGDKEDELLTKALKLHMSDIERTMFFGRRAEVNGSTSTPIRYTGGLLNMITNVHDAAGFTTANAIPESKLDQLLIENIFAYGSKQKIAFVGARVASNLMAYGKARWQPQQVDGGYGLSFTRYTTFAGDLMVYLHPQFRQVPGMANTAVILDVPYLKYRYLDGRDTALLENRQNNDEDAVKHEYLTECGLEMTQGKVHSVIKNWATNS